MAAADKVDLWFTAEGDLEVDTNGDLKDTSEVYGRSLIQEIRTRLRATTGDWVLNRTLGANLESFTGEPGTPANINAILMAIRNSLTSDLLISPGDLEIIPMPIGNSICLFRIIVITPRGELTETMAYDSDSAKFIGL
jgi:hypothetical protein